ncbi:hypothetical protein C8J57DRAFT_1502502 [Mycena rebaudengoi]|nr:hypothetical protein C8J57DRAFT_1502502 [Mycena rebaudengoi]
MTEQATEPPPDAATGSTKRKPRRRFKRMAKEDRKNLKLWAEGACETILAPHIEGYTDAMERGWRAQRDYTRDVCNEYHVQISWRLPDHAEPDLPLPLYDKFAALPPEELTEEEMGDKREHVEQLNSRIGRWLRYRAQRLRKPRKMDSKDPYTILMAKLAGINSPPKARQAFQQYMHESYKSEIAPVVAARWGATFVQGDGATLKQNRGPNAPFHSSVARDLFNELSAEEQAALKARAVWGSHMRCVRPSVYDNSRPSTSCDDFIRAATTFQLAAPSSSPHPTASHPHQHIGPLLHAVTDIHANNVPDTLHPTHRTRFIQNQTLVVAP